MDPHQQEVGVGMVLPETQGRISSPLSLQCSTSSVSYRHLNCIENGAENV